MWKRYLEVVGQCTDRILRERREKDASLPLAHVPPRCPSCVVFGTTPSRLFGEGFFVGGTVIRICHFEIGRFCYRHERRVFPAFQTSRSAAGGGKKSSWAHGPNGPGESATLHNTDLSGIDLISTKSIFVSTHRGGCGCVRWFGELTN